MDGGRLYIRKGSHRTLKFTRTQFSDLGDGEVALLEFCLLMTLQYCIVLAVFSRRDY